MTVTMTEPAVPRERLVSLLASSLDSWRDGSPRSLDLSALSRFTESGQDLLVRLGPGQSDGSRIVRRVRDRRVAALDAGLAHRPYGARIGWGRG